MLEYDAGGSCYIATQESQRQPKHKTFNKLQREELDRIIE